MRFESVSRTAKLIFRQFLSVLFRVEFFQFNEKLNIYLSVTSEVFRNGYIL